MKSSLWYRFWLMALLTTILVACAPSPPGQILLAIQTDMSLPKDINRFRVVVSFADPPEFIEDYEVSFNEDGTTKPGSELPATLNLFTRDDDDSHFIRVQVQGFRGKNDIRVVRDIVVAVQPHQVLTLPVPLEFLCDGEAVEKAESVYGNRSCGEGETCKAGACASETVAPDELQVYVAADVFGPSLPSGAVDCFDTQDCFKTILEVHQPEYRKTIEGVESCFVQPDPVATATADELTVGLETLGSGMCNDTGCYVALDADSESGWQYNAALNRIDLPIAICKKAQSGDVLQVVFSNRCPKQKRRSLPTCGPWSQADKGKGSHTDEPTVIVGGQVNPYSMEIDAGAIYWTAQGTLRSSESQPRDFVGAIRAVPLGGGKPVDVATMEENGVTWPDIVPREITTMDSGILLWTESANTAEGRIRWAKLAEDLTPNAPAEELLSGLLQPTGITAVGDSLYFAEQATGRVSKVQTTLVGDTLSAQEPIPVPSFAGGYDPYGVVAKNNIVCFAYQGTGADGIVACHRDGVMESALIADKQHLPRSLLLHEDAGKMWLYWVEFVEQGALRRADVTASGTPKVETVYTPVSRATGIVVWDKDANVENSELILYYASRDEHVVQALTYVASDNMWRPGKSPVVSQTNPVAVRVDDAFVYWIDGGESGQKNGKLMKRKRSAFSP